MAARSSTLATLLRRTRYCQCDQAYGIRSKELWTASSSLLRGVHLKTFNGTQKGIERHYRAYHSLRCDYRRNPLIGMFIIENLTYHMISRKGDHQVPVKRLIHDLKGRLNSDLILLRPYLPCFSTSAASRCSGWIYSFQRLHFPSSKMTRRPSHPFCKK
jgi:hypothetical protein